jgi:hypothetical protein
VIDLVTDLPTKFTHFGVHMHPLTVLESVLRQVYDVNLLGDNILVDTVKKNTETLNDVTKEVVLDVNL